VGKIMGFFKPALKREKVREKVREKKYDKKI
jgi:hypothetical protein